MSLPNICGRISYTNDLPIYAAFDNGAVRAPGALHDDVPSSLNAMMVDGKLDTGPVSAFFYAQHHEELVLLGDLCIGAHDEVVSVVLVSPLPPSLLDSETIYVTTDSATGANMLRILLERRYGVRPKYIPHADAFDKALAGAPALLIGDAAIDVRERVRPSAVYDLGTLWHEWTGEETVFAVWVARSAALQNNEAKVSQWLNALRASRSWAEAHPEAVIAQAQLIRPRAPGFYENYYSKLKYTYDESAQRALRRFCAELLEIKAISTMPPIVPGYSKSVAVNARAAR